jgi:spermidine synthase
MDNNSTLTSSSCSSLWINNLVNGLSGMTIRAKRALFSSASPFQKIEIFDTYSFGKVLCLADIVVLTERDEFIYHEAIIHPAMIMHANPARVCIIGGGDGGCLREAMKYKGVKSAVVVEIDQLVKDTVAEHYSSLSGGFGDPRAKVVFADGFTFFDTTKDLFDVIVVDSYDPGGPVQSLETMGFYKLVHDHLDKGGIAVFQTDSPTMKGDALRTTILNISSLFADYKPYICSLPSFPEGLCSFLVCCKDKGALGNFDEGRYSQIAPKCSYYNDEIHRGAFLLPQYLKKLMGN